MADVIKDALEGLKLADLQVSKLKSKSVVDKVLTKDDVEKAIPLLKEVSKNNGHVAIAHKLGLTQQQVAEIHQAMNLEEVEAEEDDSEEETDEEEVEEESEEETPSEE